MAVPGCAVNRSASSTPGNDVAVSSKTTAPAAEEQPFYQALQQRVGYSFQEVMGAAVRARARKIGQCLRDLGYSPTDDQLARLASDDGISLLDLAVKLVENGSAADADLGVPQDQLARCTREAQAINPLSGLISLLQSATDEISQRVAANADLQKALAQERECYRTAGLPSNRTDDEDRAIGEVVAGFKTGKLTKSEALTQLQEIRTQGASRDRARNRCQATRLAVERRVVNAEQARYLRDSPGWIDGVAEQYGPVLATIDEFLPRR